MLTSADQILERDPGLLALGAEDGEYEDGGYDRGDKVEAGDHSGGDVNPVLELVVAPCDNKLRLFRLLQALLLLPNMKRPPHEMEREKNICPAAWRQTLKSRTEPGPLHLVTMKRVLTPSMAPSWSRA